MVELCEEYSRGADTPEEDVHWCCGERGGKWFSSAVVLRQLVSVPSLFSVSIHLDLILNIIIGLLITQQSHVFRKSAKPSPSPSVMVIVIGDCSEEWVRVAMLFLYRIVIKASASPSRDSWGKKQLQLSKATGVKTGVTFAGLWGVVDFDSCNHFSQLRENSSLVFLLPFSAPKLFL